MNLATMAVFATLVINGEVFEKVATSHTYYDSGPTSFPELHIQTEGGLNCKATQAPSTRETKVVIDRQAIYSHTVEYWPRLNVWFIESRGRVKCINSSPVR